MLVATHSKIDTYFGVSHQRHFYKDDSSHLHLQSRPAASQVRSISSILPSTPYPSSHPHCPLFFPSHSPLATSGTHPSGTHPPKTLSSLPSGTSGNSLPKTHKLPIHPCPSPSLSPFSPSASTTTSSTLGAYSNPKHQKYLCPLTTCSSTTSIKLRIVPGAGSGRG
ncbi:hypothetical protein BDZ85DRAFT_268006 [Elsinoe ampelina]|uniref:Uncharacterized protein n=1 Tax=Elsinoe ampelina TaxID=302913 RepID=A0A6A6G394_9PEZI|nr:hypothetical protein BDZ85DRAFT_268006 [Elsinoe ampelina]